MKYYDYLIVGGGIIGLAIARELKTRFPDRTVCIIEKEADVAYHSSGRNSGVLHAGFYYTADSLKARFTRDGNKALTEYCKEHNLPINHCGKLVVATNETELAGLEELKRRAELNGVDLRWMDETEIAGIDPNAKTYKKALYSPATSSVNPVMVCQTIKEEIKQMGVDLYFNTEFKKKQTNLVLTNNSSLQYGYLINAAGLYADKIAKDFNFGKQYTIIPFKGIYLKYDKNKDDIVTNIYPVPNLENPFLGVHFTKTVDGTIKIGPTAIPALWRENYNGFKNFKLGEFFNILFFEVKLFIHNAFQFRRLALEEMKKYRKSHFTELAMNLVKKLDQKNFGEFLKPGIRAQLLNKDTLELVQDFVIEGDRESLHILNAVSPGFTCSLPFATYIVDEMLKKQEGFGE
ncbi:L-2-hydroxyglutarate oxidase [Peribacillus cavernae]|uniref:L-2-hydroxyglutarate oxidase n=1 Tax=Peribacillus cavernae TaxID=1674310 RepID=A0A3S0U1V9_9BACI|nr:L-2-hydroxyglutarate oxidase [Peribacillus cavernae]MDQ0218899.1 L-2-hydroxyglutarate oxidase LhgO [Peribacillus cavernae]RUQ29380.1 L-2-hydroxyglutarate oxidase [Peribacillus cavernae]